MSKKLTKKQGDILNEISTSICVSCGVDGFKANKRTLSTLEDRGLIFYGRFPPNGNFTEIGWQATEQGRAESALLRHAGNAILN